MVYQIIMQAKKTDTLLYFCFGDLYRYMYWDNLWKKKKLLISLAFK